MRPGKRILNPSVWGSRASMTTKKGKKNYLSRLFRPVTLCGTNNFKCVAQKNSDTLLQHHFGPLNRTNNFLVSQNCCSFFGLKTSERNCKIQEARKIFSLCSVPKKT